MLCGSSPVVMHRYLNVFEIILLTANLAKTKKKSKSKMEKKTMALNLMCGIASVRNHFWNLKK